MRTKKIKGFTLSEILVAMVVVGVVSLLVVPALMKNISAKSNMSKLRTVVTDLANVVEKDIVSARSDTFENTEIYNNPQSFLNNSFDSVSSGSAFATSYQSKSGNNVAINTPEASILLKSGAGLGLRNDADNKCTIVTVDVNGAKSPNTLGTDYYVLFINWESDFDKGVQMGSVGTRLTESDDELSNADMKDKCISGQSSEVEYCYKLAESTGFDPEYLDKNY